MLLILAYIFTALAFLQLGLVQQSVTLATFTPLAVLMLCGSSTDYLLRRRHWQGDPILFPLIIFLTGLGLVLTDRLANNFINRQLVWLIIATLGLLFINLGPKNLNWLRYYKYAWLIGGLILLATTLIFGVNPSGYGARLWLQFGPVYFQPSEPLKLFLVVFLAAYMADRHRQLAEVRAYIGPLAVPHPSYWGPMLAMWGLSIILLVWQRDLGGALLFFGTFIGLVYVATGQIRYVWTGVCLLLGVSIIGYTQFDVVQLRFEGFLNPWADPSGRSFQIVQSLLAFASGGFFGPGLGQGLPTAIPVVHTDFVFAAIGEEYGLVGALGIVGCFVLLITRAMHISLRADNRFEQLLATGIALMMGLQTLTIMAGTLKLMPLTGVTLPFVSYGGSSLVTSYLMVGLLMFISHKSKDLDSIYMNHKNRPSTSPFAPYQLRLSSALITAFVIVTGGLILWQIALSPFLTTRPDNPRPIIATQKIERGALLAAEGTPLVATQLGHSQLATRNYYFPQLAPITGYYSLRYGSSGAEATFDSTLRGNDEPAPLDELLHRPVVGQAVTLTINLPAQLAAETALGEFEGAVVVIDIETGAVVVMSSHPTYDPNLLDEQWEALSQDKTAPLLNRATQGLFPVGDLAYFIGLLGLHEAGAKIPAQPLNQPLVELLAPLGQTGYAATAHQLGLTRRLKHFNTQVGRLPDFTKQGTVRDLGVTPLHLARVIAALENGGQLPQPRLALSLPAEMQAAFKPTTALQMRAHLTATMNSQMIGWSAEATPQETGQTTYLSWFIGLAPTLPTPATTLTVSPADLVFDPTQITPSPPSATTTPIKKARYAIVTLVVTPQADLSAAAQIANQVLTVLIKK